VGIVYPFLLNFGAPKVGRVIQELGYFIYIMFMLSYLYSSLANPGVVTPGTKHFDRAILKEELNYSIFVMRHIEL
jgi:hypothetical protein